MMKESSIDDLHLSFRMIKWIRILGILLATVYRVVEGNDGPTRDAEIETLLSKLNKPAVRTIKTRYGDVIDCVDIYKQPAFDHPLLKNHKIKMRPSFIPEEQGCNSSGKFTNQLWLESGSCPEGTIPILRITKRDLLREDSLESFGIVRPDKPSEGGRTEQAGLLMRIGRQVGPLYTGLAADVSVWNPEIRHWEFSSSTISALGLNNLDSVVAGWMVNNVLFGEYGPRFFIRWEAKTRDSTRGCINLRCPGFVQTSRSILLGGQLHYSVYGHEPIITHITIYRDIRQRRWWLVVDGQTAGYWPFELFPSFDRAATLIWMGTVLNADTRGLHTTSHMGSGHFPEEGWGKAAHFGNLQYMNSNSTSFHRAQGLQNTVAYPRCYNVYQPELQNDPHGPRFFYGGPGGQTCDTD